MEDTTSSDKPPLEGDRPNADGLEALKTEEAPEATDEVPPMAPRTHRFIATRTLIIIYCVAYLLTARRSADFSSSSLPDQIFRWWVNDGYNALHGEWWRLVTSSLLHVSFGHFLGNMIGIAIAGWFLEPLLGSAAMCGVYLFAELLSSFTNAYWFDRGGLGASGAVYGLYGALLALYWPARKLISSRGRKWLVFWLAISCFPLILMLLFVNQIPWGKYGRGSPVHWSLYSETSHVGGLVSGIICGLYLLRRLPSGSARVSWKYHSFFLMATAVILVRLLGGTPNVAQIWREASLAYERGDFEQAIENLNRYLNIEGPNADVYIFRGDIFYRRGDYSSAILDYSNAINCDQSKIEARIWRAEAYARTDQDRWAIDDFNRAIGLDPSHADALLHRGEYYAGKNNKEGALSDFDRAVELHPNNVRAYYSRGHLHLSEKQYKAALTDFERAISIDAKDPYCYSARGQWSLDQGLILAALEDFDRAVGLDENLAEGFNLRGLAHFRLGDDERAMADWLHAWKLANAPSDKAGFLENIALIYLKRRDWQEAFDRTSTVEATQTRMPWNSLFRAIAADKLGKKELAIDSHTIWMEVREPDYVDQLVGYLPEELWSYVDKLPD